VSNVQFDRYAKANRPLSQFEIDIQRYRDQQLDIQQEDVSDNIRFVRVDYSELKSRLVSFAVDWQSRLTSLLNQNAQSDLKDLLNVMEKASTSLSANPLNLDELGDKINMLDSFTSGTSSAEAFNERFGPIEGTCWSCSVLGIECRLDLYFESVVVGTFYMCGCFGFFCGGPLNLLGLFFVSIWFLCWICCGWWIQRSLDTVTTTVSLTPPTSLVSFLSPPPQPNTPRWLNLT